MKTSQKQISRNGEGRLTSLQEASHVSHSVMPGSDEARRMTATSGHSCYVASNKSNQLGLLAKMLLESQRWFSPVKMLSWDHHPINKTLVSLMNFSLPKSKIATLRIISDIRSSARESKMSMKEFIESHRTMCLMKYARLLKKSDIPSNRYLFRLVPWELPTEETECSSLLTEWPSLLQAGLCSEERSLISPDYARNFICDFIIGKVQRFSQLKLFE